MFEKTFKKGGMHPDSLKMTKSKPIENIIIPSIVRIPMQQHLGAPATVCVESGQEVAEGQLIGKASSFVSANIHSSVPGIVEKIEKGNTFSTKNSDIVVIKTKGEFKKWYSERFNYDNKSPQELLAEIQNAGIVGLGGASFPTHVKLTPPKDKKIKILIINGVECELYLTNDHRLMIEKADDIIESIKILMRILLIDQAYIGIEINKPDAIQIFRDKLKGDPTIEVTPLKTRYPQGGEKQLIQAITGKEVPTKGLPMDVGIVVENVATAYAIFEAIVYKKPLFERIMTYTGEDVENKGNYKVRIGMTISQLFENYGKPEKYGAVIAGGPMTGIQVEDFNLPILKSTGGIIVLPKKRSYIPNDHACLKCGKCVYGCPIGLRPNILFRLVDMMKIDDAVKEGLLDCMECGTCSYVCPSEKPIVGLIRFGKDAYRRSQAKK